MTQKIAMLWMGGQFSFFESLSVRSYLDAGYGVRVYSYGPLVGAPKGVEVCEASVVMPLGAAPDTAGLPDYLVDRFRYLLLQNDPSLIWSAMDVYCHRSFVSGTGHLFGKGGGGLISTGILGLPRDSDALSALLAATGDPFGIPACLEEEARADLIAERDKGAPVHVSDMPWGVWGARALTHALSGSGEIFHARPESELSSLAFRDRERLLDPSVPLDQVVSTDTVAIQMFAPRLQAALLRTGEGVPHKDSPLGQLLEKHGVEPAKAPLRARPVPRRRRNRVMVSETPLVPSRPLDKVVAVTSMRNEGPFILDWVAYHLSVGITHFLVYTNDCDDQTKEILDALAARGLVTREDNPVTEGERPQRKALDAAWKHPVVREADAALVMDVDEYINIHVGAGRLIDLFRAAGDPDLISMTWRLFGTSGVIGYEDQPVPARFNKAAARDAEAMPHAWGFRTLLRRDAPFGGFGMHRPHRPSGSMPHWTNGSGEEMPERYLESGWRSGPDCVGYDLVTLNHYPLRAVESFLVKQDRGLDNRPGEPHGLEYWNRFNLNEVEDRSILPRLEAAAPMRRVLGEDPVLGTLHEAAVAWHKARIADLKAMPREAALFAHLSARPEACDVREIDLPEWKAPPRTEVGEVSGMAIRSDPPATGEEAETQFQGLMARTQARHPLLEPLALPPRSDRVIIVSSMKNEGCFILEWIAYHMSIGVTHFLIYTNDCDDPTNAILDRLQVMGHVTRIDNPFDRAGGQKPQRGALNDAASRPEVVLADWVGVIDVDEFVNIHVGDGTFTSLLEEARDPNVISMTWRFFGNKGVHAYEDRWQTEQFTQCAPLYLPKPRLGWGFKSFFRPDGPFSKLGVHRPLDLDAAREDEVRWVNGSGRVMPERIARKGEWFSRKDTIGYDMVTLNHYVLRSAESFLVKRQRGRINHVDQDQGLQYWAARNYASEVDTSIQRHLPRAREVLGRLMADLDLFRLHAEAVDWHRARIADLMKDEDYRALYRAITNPRLPDAIWRAQPEKETLAAE